MSRHAQVRFYERQRGKFPLPARLIVHCNSKAEAGHLFSIYPGKISGFGLELHPEKTKLVYCKSWKRKEQHEHNSFTFLSYSFQLRSKPNTFGRHDKFTVFNAANCSKAKAFIREKIRGVFDPRNTQVSLERVAAKLNPKIWGWLNYYCRFNPGIAGNVFLYLNVLIRRWIEEKFRLRSNKAVLEKYQTIVQSNSDLFIHWQKGIKY